MPRGSGPGAPSTRSRNLTANTVACPRSSSHFEHGCAVQCSNRLPSRSAVKPFLVVVQSNEFSRMPTRVCRPVGSGAAVPQLDRIVKPRVAPAFVVDGRACVLNPFDMAINRGRQAWRLRGLLRRQRGGQAQDLGWPGRCPQAILRGQCSSSCYPPRHQLALMMFRATVGLHPRS